MNKIKYASKIKIFFNQMGLYDEEAFSFIEKGKEMVSKINNKESGINKIYEDGNLEYFHIIFPEITNNIKLLECIYLYAKGIELYQILGKNPENNILDEILPVSLQRIFIDINNFETLHKKLTNIQLQNLNKPQSTSLILAYLNQFYVANDYRQTGIILIPTQIEYLDKDLTEKAKEKLKLYGE